jgi:hypothetical protein
MTSIFRISSLYLGSASLVGGLVPKASTGCREMDEINKMTNDETRMMK